MTTKVNSRMMADVYSKTEADERFALKEGGGGAVTSVNSQEPDEQGNVQLAATDVGAEPILADERKRKITYGTAAPSGGTDGDVYVQYE